MARAAAEDAADVVSKQPLEEVDRNRRTLWGRWLMVKKCNRKDFDLFFVLNSEWIETQGYIEQCNEMMEAG